MTLTSLSSVILMGNLNIILINLKFWADAKALIVSMTGRNLYSYYGRSDTLY